MKVEKKISVIVPVYNVENELSFCLDSILQQTYKNLEIIIVDDGSTDGSPIICDRYSGIDQRIKVVHTVNGGQSVARNLAIDLSTGEFIAFVDSDDWLELDTYEYCVQLMEQHSADIVQYQLVETNNHDIRLSNKKEHLLHHYKKEILQYYLYSSTCGKGGDYSLCQCLFKSNIVKNVKFREGKINEDIDFKYRVFSKANHLVTSNIIKYYYYQHGATTSMGGLKKKDFDLYDAAEELKKLTEDETYGNIRFLAKIKQARTPLSLLCKIAYFGVSDPSIDKEATIKQLIKEHRSNVGILLRAPLPLSRKVLAILFAINYKLAEICIKIAK